MADVLRLVVHVPHLGLGSLDVSSVVRILDLEDAIEEAVESSLAPSSIEFDGSTRRSHGWSICFQNHTICPFVVPCKVEGFALGDIGMWDGPLCKPHILPALVVV